MILHFQWVKRLFGIAFNNTLTDNDTNTANWAPTNSNIKHFFPRMKIKIINYNIIHGRIFKDQPINDSIKKYDGIRKITIGKEDDYATVCLIYALDADPITIKKTSSIRIWEKNHKYVLFLKNLNALFLKYLKKQFYNFLKEQQTFCKDNI